MSAVGAQQPVTIAHRAGNCRASLEAAKLACVDFIEADLCYVRGGIIARHEKALWRLPLLYDKWALRFARQPALYLHELCAASADGPRLLLDFKGSDLTLPTAVVAQLQDAGAGRLAALCGQNWRLLDYARALEPGLQVFYSIETAAQVDALRSRPSDVPPVAAASVWEGLLSPNFIRELQERGIVIFAWTVNSPARAEELIASGVSGIISDRLDLLNSLSAPDDQGTGLTGAGLQI